MSSQVLFAKLVQERALHAGKIGNAKMRKVRAELLNSTAAFIASLHHHLITYTRSCLIFTTRPLRSCS